MFEKLKQAMEKKAMSEKKQPLSYIGGEVEPSKYNLNIEEVDLTKRYKDWADGYTVPKENQPSSSKVTSNDEEGKPA
jgi:hypothetical protein